MRKSTFLCLSLSLFSVPARAEWEGTSGPTDLVQIHCMVFKDSQMITGVVGHGIYKTTDDGKFWWRPNTDWAGLVHGLGFQGRYLIAAGDAGLFRSADDGQTWTYSVKGMMDKDLRALAVDGADLYVGARDSGVYYSSDSATTWTETSTGLPRAAVISIASGGGAVLAGTDGAGLYRSADKGLNWTRVATGGRNGLAVFDLEDAGTFIYAGTDSGLYRFARDGSGWSESGAGLAGRRVNAVLARGSRLYAGTDSGVFLSGDGGTQWRLAGMTGFSVRSLGERGGIVYAGTDWFGLYRSSDQGDSWNTHNQGFFYGYANLVVRSGNAILATVSTRSEWENRGFRTTDEGFTWTPMLPGVKLATLAANGSHAYALGLDAVVYQSYDGGATWKTGPNPGTLPGMTGLVAAPGWLYGTGKDGIYRSREGASPWERMPVNMTTSSWYWLRVSGKQLYFRGDSATLRSLDSGATWEATSLPRYAIPHCAIGTHHLARAKGPLLRSDDDGATWQETGLKDTLFSDVIAVGQDFYVSDYSGKLHRSADFGRTWTHFEMDGGGLGIIGSLAAGEYHLFATNGEGGVRRRKWSEIASATKPLDRRPGKGETIGFSGYSSPMPGRRGKLVFFFPAGRIGRLSIQDISGKEERVLWEGRSNGDPVEVSPAWSRAGAGIRVLRLESGPDVRYRMILISP